MMNMKKKYHSKEQEKTTGCTVLISTKLEQYGSMIGIIWY